MKQKKLSISERTKITSELKNSEMFFFDLELFKEKLPYHKLNKELVRVNAYNKNRLHGMLIYELLLVASKEDIENNRQKLVKKEEDAAQIILDRTEAENSLNEFVSKLSEKEVKANNEKLQELKDFILEENFTSIESKKQFDALLLAFKEEVEKARKKTPTTSKGAKDVISDTTKKAKVDANTADKTASKKQKKTKGKSKKSSQK